ncbi:MAG: NERD domain-containing protein [gamma proteobacterium endosymbiont of Lamellibrachia anaximandri]|nr:NERD domain-containing protein [gamma proteobacterium endosymbiont of Lamellibrachia anaximandri]MBL3619236.1 NERD domain-containing protein [gamma proteobacterium endosymbiont of Lamellibrachia anaximandri]
MGLALKDIGEDVLNDILIPDGKGGLTQLDHVVLAPSGLWVIETKNYKGLIFGGEREKCWTQRLG